MANNTTGTTDIQCLECKSESISIFHEEFTYQVMGGRKPLTSEVLTMEVTFCFDCDKTFISEYSLPPNFVKNLSAGYLRIHNPIHFGRPDKKRLKICREPHPYKPTS